MRMETHIVADYYNDKIVVNQLYKRKNNKYLIF